MYQRQGEEPTRGEMLVHGKGCAPFRRAWGVKTTSSQNHMASEAIMISARDAIFIVLTFAMFAMAASVITLVLNHP